MGGHAMSPNLDFSDPIDEALPLDMSKASCRFPDPPSMSVRVTPALPSGAAKDSHLLRTAEGLAADDRILPSICDGCAVEG